jgi:hypothetical protein
MGFKSGVRKINLISPDLIRKGATKLELAVSKYLERLRIEGYLEGREGTVSVMRQKGTYSCLNLCYPVASVQA